MSFKLPFLVGSLVIVSFATGIAAASAAETGTKTMPDSSTYPHQRQCSILVNTTSPICQARPRRELTVVPLQKCCEQLEKCIYCVLPRVICSCCFGTYRSAISRREQRYLLVRSGEHLRLKCMDAVLVSHAGPYTKPA
jgi:hypothetical protein